MILTQRNVDYFASAAINTWVYTGIRITPARCFYGNDRMQWEAYVCECVCGTVIAVQLSWNYSLSS